MFLEIWTTVFLLFFSVFISTQIHSNHVPFSLYVQKCESTAAECEYNYFMIWRLLQSHHRQKTFFITGIVVQRTHYSKYSENCQNQCLFVLVSLNCTFSSMSVNLYFPMSSLKHFWIWSRGLFVWDFFIILHFLCPQKHFSNNSKLPESMPSSPLRRFFHQINC